MMAEDYNWAVSVSLELPQARWLGLQGRIRLWGGYTANERHTDQDQKQPISDVNQTTLSASFYSGVGGAESTRRRWLGREEERQAGEHDAISER